jgi:hypothetical protein
MNMLQKSFLHMTNNGLLNYGNCVGVMPVLLFALTQQFFTNTWTPLSFRNVMATNAAVKTPP